MLIAQKKTTGVTQKKIIEVSKWVGMALMQALELW